MNIGIFTDTYYPQINGVATSAFLLKTQLEKLGHKVYIITTSDPNDKSKLPRVFRMPSMPFIFSTAHRVTYIYSPKLIFNFKKLKLDIIHTQTEFAIGLFAKALSDVYDIPLVHTYHTMYEDYVHYVAKGHLITPKMMRTFSRVFCNRASQIIAPTLKTKEKLLCYGVTKPIEIIPTGLDFSALRRENYSKDEISALKKELNIKENEKVVIFVGRLAYEKSLHIVIEGFSKLVEKLPETKLVLVGSGPMESQYKELANKLNISDKVVFTGAKPYKDIGKYYQLGDLFTTASTSETQGITYLEALATKVPVVAKNDKSLENVIIHEKTGFLFDSMEEYVDLLHYVLTNKEKAQEVALNGNDSIQSLTVEQFGLNVLDLYTKTIEAKKQRPMKTIFKIKKMLGR